MKRSRRKNRKPRCGLRCLCLILMLIATVFGLDIQIGDATIDIMTQAGAHAETPTTVPVDMDLPATEPMVMKPVVMEPMEGEKLGVEDMIFDRLYTEEDVIALAQMAWGEALITHSDTEMAATMWCALNRFDCGDPYYAKCKTIAAIVQQKGAFDGYRPSNPIDDHLVELARDVLDRWCAEKAGYEDVGRVLPEEYLFFHGDGWHNHFRIEYRGDGTYWDWSLESPYET